MSDVLSLHEQVKRGDLTGVQVILTQHPALLNETNSSGQSAFLLAKYYGQAQIADYLLSLNPKLDLFTACVAGRTEDVRAEIEQDRLQLEAHNPDGWTALHLAAFFDHAALADALIELGSPLEIQSTNAMQNTPLHAAVAGRQFEVVRVLLQGGADVNALQQGGWRALNGAAQNGDRPIVELLLAHGAETQARAENNQAAFDLALSKGHSEVAALLEELQANPY